MRNTLEKIKNALRYYSSILLKEKRAGILLMGFLSLFFFVGLGNFHLFDWDEINFAESAREMLESHNYSLVQINYTPFWEKPPFFFWLQAISMKMFGINDFAARLPNAVFGFIYLITIFIMGRKLKDNAFGIIWSLLYFGSFLPHLYFKSGIIDPVFNYFIFLAVYFTAQIFESKGTQPRYAMYAGLSIGISFITKGPVGLLLLLLTLFCIIVYRYFSQSGLKDLSLSTTIEQSKKYVSEYSVWKNIYLFSLGFLIIVATWLLAEVYHHGFDILAKFIYYQIELFNSPVAGHGQPFYYHFVVVLLGCFPASVFALPSLIRSKNGPLCFFRVWMVALFWVVMIIFSISTTKIVHYSSMTYLPLTFLAALYVYGMIKKNSELKKYVLFIYLIIGFFWATILTAALFLLNHVSVIIPFIKDDFAVQSLLTPVFWSGYEPAIGLVFASGLIIALICFLQKKHFKALFAVSLSVGLTLLLLAIFVLPGVERFTQGPAIDFYQSLEYKDVYVETVGFKSYAQYFYKKSKPGQNPKRTEKEWLLYGDIDKPVYFVTKVNNTELDTISHIIKIKTEGGFSFYKRNNVSH
ncbi:MAG: glycosyltransferase family 39 protein [Saprospiraceae bacterium]|nr:glycosyltransferase family 39 protein [Saprospiraceae bacterium]